MNLDHFPSAHRASPPRAGRRILAIYAAFTLLVATNVLMGVALLMTPELKSFFATDDSGILQAYEQRILDLRMEVDRLHSRQFRQTGDLNLQMQELAQQQQFLAEQHSFVRILAQKAEELGLQPDGDVERVASFAPTSASLGLATSFGQQPPSTLDEFGQNIEQMVLETRLALTTLSNAADQSTNEILEGLNEIGIRPTLPSINDLATGGPFEPPQPGLASISLADQANHVLMSLERFSAAREALTGLPIFYPLRNVRQISSRFGNRSDPFNGHQAFHAGIDFPAPRGTAVFATGAGKVITAGRSGGYGNLIEIEHNGIVTRYAHLSAINVRVGELVIAGEKIGEVGTTGRSTGAHLHYEVRIDGIAKNPIPYVGLGTKLQNYLI